MRKMIALLHKDKEYITKLMEYSKKKKDITYEIFVFSKVETLKNYLENAKVDLIVCSEDFELDEEVVSKVTKVIYFTDYCQEESLETNNIFMYQSAEDILSQMYSVNEKKQHYITNDKEKKATIIGTYSPYEGFWNSIVSFFIAYTYATKKSTLFLSFDPFFPRKLVAMDEKNYDLSDLIYYTKQGEELFEEKVKKCIRTYENVDVVIGCEHYTDLLELTEDDISFVMNQLITRFSYEVIIIELGAWSEVTTKLLEYCNQVYKLMYNNPIFYEKDKEFERQINRGKKKDAVIIKQINMPKEEWKEELFHISTLYKTSFGEYIKNCLIGMDRET